ncbi:uncharacterized protein LOC106662713 [Cimex lectularius]|uniref:Uncharacterized protein n=1 Tax=Cimex lectularius TaxID=79782 RepID=A0A8I6RC75_CIMLE|nr:uncharacterized protein LOC106662713 [Cimex lectularius]
MVAFKLVLCLVFLPSILAVDPPFLVGSFIGKEVKTDKKPATPDEVMMLLKALSHMGAAEAEVFEGDSEDSLVQESENLEENDEIGQNRKFHGQKRTSGNSAMKYDTGKLSDPQELARALGSTPSPEKLKRVVDMIKQHNVSIYSTNFDFIVD